MNICKFIFNLTELGLSLRELSKYKYLNEKLLLSTVLIWLEFPNRSSFKLH